ncbi:hypothetical protein ACPPVU_16050 [Mucilaginibacter sp. McL0603]|uniref:hypothetical protein n=1 Tax=Mucilaginibacter sp. McL0603 TaxID=3415670 RepID=UPI003CF17D04
MMEMNDDELQRLFESGNQILPGKSLNNDEKAYQALFEALKSEPGNGLPYNFASKVIRHIQAEQKPGSELKYNLIALILFIVALATVCSALAIFNPGATSALLKYKWVLLLFPVVFIAIQYFDQKLVKRRIFSIK